MNRGVGSQKYGEAEAGQERRPKQGSRPQLELEAEKQGGRPREELQLQEGWEAGKEGM